MSLLSLYSLLTVVLLLLVLSLILMNSTSFASSTSTPPRTEEMTVTTPSTSPSHQSMGIKITSPTTGQQVPVVVGRGVLKISGTSTDDVLTNCQVSVIINNIKPYQLANATGSGGKEDYSRWDYFLLSSSSSKYPPADLIKAGPNNKITAKLVCSTANSSLTKWYSVNVTGIVPVSSSLLSSPNALATPHPPPPQLVGNYTNMTTTTTTTTTAA